MVFSDPCVEKDKFVRNFNTGSVNHRSRFAEENNLTVSFDESAPLRGLKFAYLDRVSKVRPLEPKCARRVPGLPVPHKRPPLNVSTARIDTPGIRY